MDAKIEKVLERERSQPCRWWYLSFCSGEGFLGAAIVLAPGMVHAAQRCHQLGINPGGEVLGGTLPENDLPPPEARDRLLSKADIKHFFDAVQRVNSTGQAQGPPEGED